MSGIIKTIKAKDDNNIQHNIFPKTVLEAVVDSETNETLDAILGDKLTKTDIVDNCLSNRADLPLSANMGRDINERLNAHSERFEVLYEHDTFSVVKMGKIIRFYGEIILYEQNNAWNWVADFTAIVQEYKPRVKRYFKDISQQYIFELTEHGFIQTTQVIPAGTYYLDVAWLTQ